MIKALWLERMPIEEALAWQDEIFHNQNGEDACNHLLLCEHEPCYTTTELPIEECLRISLEEFTRLNVQVIPVRRGGGATFHGPGQLVVYCIIDMVQLKIGTQLFNKMITEGVRHFLSAYGITTTKLPCDLSIQDNQRAHGLWVSGERKILSRGLLVTKNRHRRVVTRFGFALNISTDLTYFSYIYPCGLDIEMTSLEKEIGRTFILSDLIKPFIATLNDVLNPLEKIFLDTT